MPFDLQANEPSIGPSPQSLQALGRWGLSACLVLSIAGLLGTAWTAPTWLFLFPVSLVGVFVLGFLVRHPIAHLCGVLLILTFVFSKEEGIQVTEAAAGLYYMTYLTGWFAYHVGIRRERLLHHPVDFGVALLLGFTTLSLPLTVLLNGDLVAGLRQWSVLLLLAFYFPIKSACASDRRALYFLLFTFGVLALFVAARNFYRYYEVLQGAEELWRVVMNRSRENERILMMGLLGSLVFLVFYARAWWTRIVLLGFSVLMLAGVVVGLSRAVWLAVAFGLGMLFLIVSARQKLRLLVLGSAGAAFLVVVAAFLLDDVFSLVLSGLSTRLGSIGTAGTRDLSLINRFYEWGVTWDYAMQSPIVGWGFGVPFPYYNLIYGISQDKFYVHSTYLGVLYRHGFIGLGLLIFVITGSIVRGIRHAQHALTAPIHRAVAFACVASLAALALAATTEGLLIDAEGVFSFMFPTALLAGIHARRESSSSARP